MQPLISVLLVGLGGFVGSVSRYALTVASQRLSIQWPAGTFASNMIGCILIGILTTIPARGHSITPELRLTLAVGFCGGFTTMSSMIHETTLLLRTGHTINAAIYSIGTLFFSMLAFTAGSAATRLLDHRTQ